MIVRYADDTVLGFESKTDVDRFLEDLKVRFAKFGLTLNEEKTRVLQFGRFAAAARARQGLSKPPTFDFLGFTHIRGVSRSNGLVPAEAAGIGEVDARQPRGDQTGAEPPHAGADPRNWPMAAVCGPGLLQLSRCSWQCRPPAWTPSARKWPGIGCMCCGGVVSVDECLGHDSDR